MTGERRGGGSGEGAVNPKGVVPQHLPPTLSHLSSKQAEGETINQEVMQNAAKVTGVTTVSGPC